MAKQDEGKRRFEITTLADLQPRDVEVEIERDNEVLVIPCRALSYAEFQRLGYEVVDPAPPASGATAKGPIYNYNDPEYLAARQKAADERLYRRLLAFVQIDVPGDTVAEQIENLTNALELDVVKTLVAAMTRISTESEARVQNRATTFHK